MNTSTAQRRPIAVALANRFLWQLLLTDTWDHVFLGDINVFPRELSFCPTKDVWKDGAQIEGDTKLISYFEYSIGSCVILGMMRDRCEGVELWYPNSIVLDMRILRKDLVDRHGSPRLITPPIKVWNKKFQN